MRISACCIVAGALLAALSAASAAPFEFDCDTNEGSYSELAQSQTGPAYRVRGAITPLQWREDERWLPSAQIRIENPERTRSIAVQLVRSRGAERALFGVEVATGGEPRATTLGEVALDEAVSFDLRLLPSGDAVVTLGGERAVYRLDIGRDARITAICSTGEFLFSGLDFEG